MRIKQSGNLDAKALRVAHQIEALKTQHTSTLWVTHVAGEKTRTIEEVAIYGGPNAAYIVRAVNSHEEMVKAIKRVREMMDAPCHCHDDPITPGKCDFCVARRIMDKAIAKAEGKE